jgi:hypothetical protein
VKTDFKLYELTCSSPLAKGVVALAMYHAAAQVNIMFCCKPGRTATQTYGRNEYIYKNEAISCMHVSE